MTATLGAVSGSSTLTVTAASLTSISVTPTNPTVSIYTTQQFTATGIYSDNTVEDLTSSAIWSTQSALVAIVSNQPDSKGSAVGVGVGSTGVVATFGGVSGSTNINVTSAVLTGIDISPTNANLVTNSELSYTATGIYNNGRTEDITTSVTWQSSNYNIASISNAPGSEGVAKGVQAGSAVISASLDGVSDSTNITVTAPALTSITVTPASPTVPNGLEEQFTATGNYSDGTTADLTSQVTWTSGTPSVAVISNDEETSGLATALSAGSSVISAQYNGVSGNTTMTVTAAVLTSITVTPANASIPVNTNIAYTATGVFSDASTENITREVTWRSSNNSVAAISNADGTHGVATGVGIGSTTISATRGAVSGSTALSVVNVAIGDNLGGGVVACLGGGLDNLITAVANNATQIRWGGNGTTTNAQSEVNGQANTTRIVNVLGAGITYAAGLCEAYEIDSAGNTPCVGGNTCYDDWFLPAINQLTCMRNNRNQVGGFNKSNYWSSTEYSRNSSQQAMYITFANSGHPPEPGTKSETYAVRCVRLING